MEGAAVGSVLATALANVTMTGITAEIVGVLPIVLPVAISCIAIRKGIGFLMGTLRGA